MTPEEFNRRVSLLGFVWHRPPHEVEELLDSGRVGFSAVEHIEDLAQITAGEGARELFYWLHPKANDERHRINARNEIVTRHYKMLQTLTPGSDAYVAGCAEMKRELHEFDHGDE